MKRGWSSQRRGLTILELIITITVIGIVTGIGYKAYTGIREESQIRAKQRTAQHINELLDEVRQFDASLIGSGGSFAVNTASVETLVQSLSGGVTLPDSVMQVKLSRAVTAGSYTLQGTGVNLQVLPTPGASAP